ncbi:chromate transporter [Paenibacillus sp. JX-17]|uniref:Chromate transporter n=1 Tax=Paenibacillus lacisoli TaxID=3064525 RepID=A0ABT9CHF9_9BACL|nr:chromate transporter [Paenibacillus sp. JX-17]MDO7908717.1 chromate transporter [Paenibacillus sp. JX-17]
MSASFRQNLSVLLQLFWLFLKIGPSTFGGGYAMIPVLEKEIVDKRRWISRQEMSDLMSLASSAPGGVGINASACLGYRMGKIPGAFVATVGITLPTFLIVFALSMFYSAFQDVPKVQAAFKGIHGAVIGLIAVAAYRMGRSSIFDRATVLIAASSLIVLLLTGLNPSFMILAGLVLGMAVISAKRLLGMTVVTEKKPSAEQPVIEYYI